MTKLIRNLYLVLFFFTPLIFTSFNSELFELPKMYFIYSLTIIIVALHLFNYFRGNTLLHRRTPLDLPLLFFLFSQIIATVISVDPHTSVFGYYSRLNGGLLSTLSYLLLFWVFSAYASAEFNYRIIIVSFASGLLVSLFGILEHFGIDKHLWVQDVQNRVFSTLGQPNWLSAYLCLLLPFSLDYSFRYFKEKKYFKSAACSLLFIIFFICLLFTKSKSGIIAAGVTLILYFVADFIKSYFKVSRFLLFSYLLIAALSLVIRNPIKDYLLPPPPAPTAVAQTQTLLITPSEDIRKIVWTGAIDLWKKYPYFGTGVESFAYSYYWTRPSAHNLTSEWDFLYNKAHNEYINYLATTGIFGFGTYLILLGTMVFIFLKNFSSPLSLPALAAFASLLVTNFAGFSVVITSLFLFTLPLLSLTAPLPAFKSKRRLGFLSPAVVIVAIVLLQKIVFFYLADIAYSRSQTLDSQNQYELALAKVNRSLTLRPDEPIYLQFASTLESKTALVSKSEDGITRAIGLSNQAILESPANLNLWKERAQMFYYLSALDSKYFPYAIDALEKASKIAPTDAKSYYLLGKFYQTAGLLDKSRESYKKSLELKPNYDYASFALGQIFFEEKDYQTAKTYFDTTLKITPQNQEAQEYLSQIATLSANPKLD